jgi:hypothetical protein
MAKRKSVNPLGKVGSSPNAGLIAAPIPYDPALMAAAAANAQQQWQKLELLRSEVYAIMLPWYRAARVAAIQARDQEEVMRVDERADDEWQAATSTSAITSFETLEDLRAHAQAANYRAQQRQTDSLPGAVACSTSRGAERG